MGVDDTVHTDLCCVCLRSYEDDAGTDREWLQCKSQRWIDEDYVDTKDFSANGRLCPLY